MDANPDGHPRRGLTAARCVDQRAGGGDGSTRVVRAGKRWNEDADRLVADEPVDDGIVLDEHPRRRIEEAIHDCVDLGRSHRFGHGRGPAHVREHQAAADLGTAVVIRELAEALAAKFRVLGPASFAQEAHQRPADAAERRSAELAARIGRQVAHQPATGPHLRLGAREDPAPQVVVAELLRFVHQPSPAVCQG
jgi:hypothetical protein